DELARVEPQVTAEMAPFDAPSWLTWRPGSDLAEGMLLGRLTIEEMPGLRVPLVLRLPRRRGVWISRGAVPGDAAAYAWSLVAPLDARSGRAGRPGSDLAEGMLRGRLTIEETPGLRVPLVLRLPWRRGVWISRGAVPGDSAAYAWSLVTRFLAAVPPGLAGLE